MSPLARAATYFGRTRQDSLLRSAVQRSADGPRAARLAERHELQQLLAEILALDETNRTLLLRAVAMAGRQK